MGTLKYHSVKEGLEDHASLGSVNRFGSALDVLEELNHIRGHNGVSFKLLNLREQIKIQDVTGSIARGKTHVSKTFIDDGGEMVLLVKLNVGNTMIERLRHSRDSHQTVLGTSEGENRNGEIPVRGSSDGKVAVTSCQGRSHQNGTLNEVRGGTDVLLSDHTTDGVSKHEHLVSLETLGLENSELVIHDVI